MQFVVSLGTPLSCHPASDETRQHPGKKEIQRLRGASGQSTKTKPFLGVWKLHPRGKSSKPNHFFRFYVNLWSVPRISFFWFLFCHSSFQGLRGSFFSPQETSQQTPGCIIYHSKPPKGWSFKNPPKKKTRKKNREPLSSGQITVNPWPKLRLFWVGFPY